MAIYLRSAEELEKMHRAGLYVHEVLAALRSAVKPGISTMDLEKLAEGKIAGRPGKAAFKGYRGYPCVLCTSVNSEIVHGIPSLKRKLREGGSEWSGCGMGVGDCWAAPAASGAGGRGRPVVDTRWGAGWSRPVPRWGVSPSGTGPERGCPTSQTCRTTET